MRARWRHRGCRAAGDPGDGDAGARQQVEPHAVQRGERLHLMTKVVDVDLAVGQDAVDVAGEESHAARASQRIGRH
jgi:hypothetical protein